MDHSICVYIYYTQFVQCVSIYVCILFYNFFFLPLVILDSFLNLFMQPFFLGTRQKEPSFRI